MKNCSVELINYHESDLLLTCDTHLASTEALCKISFLNWATLWLSFDVKSGFGCPIDDFRCPTSCLLTTTLMFEPFTTLGINKIFTVGETTLAFCTNRNKKFWATLAPSEATLLGCPRKDFATPFGSTKLVSKLSCVRIDLWARNAQLTESTRLLAHGTAI